MLKNTRTTKMLFAAVAAFGISLAAAQASAATTTVFSGTMCRPHRDSLGIVEYGPFGVHNVSTTAFQGANVSCPIPVTSAAFMQSFSVKIYDRNNGGLPSLVGNDFSCQIIYQNAVGTTIGGPTAANPGAFNVPNFLGLSANVSANVYGASLECSIPTQTASGFSHILNYSIVTN